MVPFTIWTLGLSLLHNFFLPNNLFFVKQILHFPEVKNKSALLVESYIIVYQSASSSSQVFEESGPRLP